MQMTCRVYMTGSLPKIHPTARFVSFRDRAFGKIPERESKMFEKALTRADHQKFTSYSSTRPPLHPCNTISTSSEFFYEKIRTSFFESFYLPGRNEQIINGSVSKETYQSDENFTLTLLY